MSEAILIFQHMRGGCATVGNTVHALFRVNGRRPGLASTNRLTPTLWRIPWTSQLRTLASNKLFKVD